MTLELSFLNIAGGKDQLVVEMNEAWAYLIQTRSDWAQHIDV